MNLPNYFLADLPPDATLTAAMVAEACLTLKRNRKNYLASRSTQNLAEILGGVAAAWLRPENAFRKLALENAALTGFSRATLECGLDGFFRELTPGNLQTLLEQELGERACHLSRAGQSDARHVWRGPELLVHITAGSIPNPALMSLVLGVLTRSAQFAKCASGSSFLPRLFAHSIYQAEPKLGACLELAEWRGGRSDLETVLFEHAECVTATGGDETLEKIRALVPLKTRFLAYGHRVSFAFVAREALSGAAAAQVASRAASDVIAWNQLGCLSPHLIYVQKSGALSAEQFAELLAAELAGREKVQPRGEVPVETAAAIASRRAFYEVRAAHSPETRFWRSEASTAWTVIYESDPLFQLSCLNRFVYVKPAADLAEALQGAELVRDKTSTVGLAAPEERSRELAAQLAHWGATRVCLIGRMQQPPLTWRHDGRPALGDLVTWTDFET